MTAAGDAALVSRFRRALLALASVTSAGTAAELALQRHWNGIEQFVPWFALAVVVAGVIVAAANRGRTATVIGRAIGLCTLAAGVFGVYEHVAANHHAGPLDFRYTDRWPTMPAASRWWAAATGEVGPSPPLAPAILTLAGACLFLALLGCGARQPSPSSTRTVPGDDTARQALRREAGKAPAPTVRVRWSRRGRGGMRAVR